MLTLDNIAGRFTYNEDHEAFRQTLRRTHPSSFTAARTT